jgi:hypothetical protein
MRNVILTVAAGVAMMLMSLGSASAGSVAPAAGASVAVESGVVQVQGSRYCNELRRACEMKDSLGERGGGNCRRYREECGGGHRSYCERLRKACMYKEERGERGEGNCRRYREECR